MGPDAPPRAAPLPVGRYVPGVKRDVHEAIQGEIRSEKASSLTRAVEALEAALEDLARYDAAPRAARERAELLAEAGERLWFVVIQREAMGLRRHEVLYEVVRVPAEVRRAMGPRPRR